jgi:hypothetical protein
VIILLFREIAQRFGEGVRVLFVQVVQFDFFMHDLFLEQRVHDRRGGPGVFRRRSDSSLLVNGLADATSGFFSFRPR